MKKRLFAGALALLMIIGLLPVSSMSKKPIEAKAGETTYTLPTTLTNEDSHTYTAVYKDTTSKQVVFLTVYNQEYMTKTYDDSFTTVVKFDNIKYRVNYSERWLAVCGYAGNDKDVVIPSVVEKGNVKGFIVSEIDDLAFNGCSSIEILTLSDTIMKVGETSFLQMDNLQAVISKAKGINIIVTQNVKIVTSRDQLDNDQMNNGEYLIRLLANVVAGKPLPESDDNIDLLKVYEIAEKHSVQTTAYYGIKKLQCAIPSETLSKWEEAHLRGLSTSIRFKAELNNVCDMFTKEKLVHVPLKGSIIKNMYPSIDMRTMSDMDILIKHEDAKKAHDILIGMGYTCDTYDTSHQDVYFKDPIYNIEIHTSLFDDGDGGDFLPRI